MRMRLAAIAVLALSCGGGHKSPSEPAAPESVTEAQCREMADHMLDVQIAARPTDERPAPEQEAEIREGIRNDFVPACVREVLKPTYDCWMAAESVEAFEVCAGGESSPPPEGTGPDPAPADAGP